MAASLRFRIGLLACLACIGAHAAERAAEVVSVQGQGESRADERAAWKPATPRQELFASNFVRTGSFSRMGLLFQDRTQVRLAEKTLMQIKSAASGPAERTVLRLEQGRSWSQTNAASSNLYLETPSATAAIRGTDWEIEVFEGGRALLTVFSGEVEFFNDFGRVVVARNESAQAVPGQAPTKLLIANPRDRVQWVTAFSVDPLRHIDVSKASPALREVLEMVRGGRTAEATARLSSAADDPELLRLARIAILVRAERLEEAFNAASGELASARQPGAFLIASDLMVYAGRLDRADDIVMQGLARLPGDPRLVAQRARVSLAAGQFD
jgi:FecR-like protein